MMDGVGGVGGGRRGGVPVGDSRGGLEERVDSLGMFGLGLKGDGVGDVVDGSRGAGTDGFTDGVVLVVLGGARGRPLVVDGGARRREVDTVAGRHNGRG